jgi:hypothetical protein
MLSGFKTYISGALVVLFSILYAAGVIEGETFLKLLGIFLPIQGMALRSAIAGVKNDVAEMGGK